MEIVLDWKYFSDLRSLQSYRDTLDRDKAGMYLWIMKHPNTPRVMYVGESETVWMRNISHLEESLAGRWMWYFWGENGEGEDYVEFIRKYIDGKTLVEIDSLNKNRNQPIVEYPKYPWAQHIEKDMFDLNKIEKRIEYLSTRISFAFATEDGDTKLTKLDVRLDVETILITRLREHYGLKGLFGTKRPQDLIVGGLKKSMSKIKDVELIHRGEYKAEQFPNELGLIRK